MFMMFFLTLFVLIDPTLRGALGTAAGAVFGPTIGFGAAFPVITILIAGTITTLISSSLRHVFTDWVKMTRVNKRMSAIRKAQMDALRKGNQAKVQKLRQQIQGMQKETFDVQLAPMKSMAFTFLLFIIIFAWLNDFVYFEVLSAGRTLFSVPWSPHASLVASYVLPSWILLYSLLAIPVSQVVTRVLRYVSFRKRLDALDAGAG